MWIVAPNLGNYLSGNCTDKVVHSSHNTGLRQLRRSTPAAKPQYSVPPQSVLDPVAVVDVRPGLSDSDHYVNKMQICKEIKKCKMHKMYKKLNLKFGRRYRSSYIE